MFVLTVDQQGSTRVGDRVPQLLDRLAPVLDGLPGVRLGFERTVGDEVQAVVEDADAVLLLAMALLRLREWSVGIGAGTVHLPLPASTREASGEAFVNAREAVERAKSKALPVPVAVVGPQADRSREATALLGLLGGVAARRTRSAWEAIDALHGSTRSQRQAAAELGITEQAVSQRLQVALWHEERAVHPLAARLLHEAQGPDTDGDRA